ncbi:MAG: pyridoxamine 5'-phosphate oxidase family protein [Hyphomonadaceae bacterium]|nr:pyridoxamine 5'-phosphate oxidase family protein [Hyphomonadaceae bacterium]
MATIPKKLHQPIMAAFPQTPCLVATVLPNGYAQVTPRGSVQAFDDDHLSIWERGRGSTNANLHDGSKVTVYLHNWGLKESGVLPIGGLVRFYGIASIHKSGQFYDEVWRRLIDPEKNSDPEKKGFAVLVRVERTEDLLGNLVTD